MDFVQPFLLCVLRVFILFFCGKEKYAKESRPKKKLQFFRVGTAMSDSATALPG
jgi:hypothetical protein